MVDELVFFSSSLGPLFSCEANNGWDSDPVTGVLYQRNTQATLTWHQARKSCQQQDADLLSVVELHEQTYIAGICTPEKGSRRSTSTAAHQMPRLTLTINMF